MPAGRLATISFVWSDSASNCIGHNRCFQCRPALSPFFCFTSRGLLAWAPLATARLSTESVRCTLSAPAQRVFCFCGACRSFARNKLSPWTRCSSQHSQLSEESGGKRIDRQLYSHSYLSRFPSRPFSSLAAPSFAMAIPANFDYSKVPLSAPENLLCSLTASCVAETVTYPFEVAKVRLQIQGERPLGPNESESRVCKVDRLRRACVRLSRAGRGGRRNREWKTEIGTFLLFRQLFFLVAAKRHLRMPRVLPDPKRSHLDMWLHRIL